MEFANRHRCGDQLPARRLDRQPAVLKDQKISIMEFANRQEYVHVPICKKHLKLA